MLPDRMDRVVDPREAAEELAIWFGVGMALLSIGIAFHGTFTLWTAEIAEAGVTIATPASSTTTR